MKDGLEFLKVCNEIKDWFKSTFPDVSDEQQSKKVYEELAEIEKETTFEGKQREAVDLFIAIIGEQSEMIFDINCPISMELAIIYRAFNLTPEMIREKLEINKKRKWELDKYGVPHHIDN